MKKFLHTAVVRWISSIRSVHAIDPGRIACIELSRMGDVLVMLPALRLLRTGFPSSEIIAVVQQPYAGFLRLLGIVDGVIGIEKRNILSTVKILRTREVTLACSMSPATTNAFCALFGARASIGYLGAPDTLPGILDRSTVTGIGAEVAGHDYFMENLYQRGAKICRSLGIQTEPLPTAMAIDADWEHASVEILHTLDLAIHSNYIILHPLAGWEFRMWPVERWRRLLEMIIGRTTFDCLLISSANERARIEAIAPGNPRIRCVAGLPVEHLAVLMKRSAGFIGNDSGPIHIAAALGIPVIGLFGPADPRYTAPTFGHCRYFFQRLECSPCSQRRCVRPRNSCMMQLDPDSIFNAIEEFFGTPSVQTGGRNS